MLQNISLRFTQGLDIVAAERFWADQFADPSVRKDQVEAVNKQGVSIGKAGSQIRAGWDSWGH